MNEINTDQTPTIKQRHPQFDFSRTARYWHDNDPFRTHFFNAMSCSFPPVEGYLIKTVNEAMKKIASDGHIDGKGFIGQEGTHSKVHIQLNNRLKEFGYPVDRIEKRLLKKIAITEKSDSLVQRLAACACLEHYTAIMANLLFSVPEITAGMDPNLLELWRWHAVEEIEHKAVTFDLFLAAGGTRRRRTLTMVLVTVNFWIDTIIDTGILLKQDRLLFAWTTIRSGFSFILGKNGVFRGIWKQYRDFYRRDFHPWRHDNAALIADWESANRLQLS